VELSGHHPLDSWLTSVESATAEMPTSPTPSASSSRMRMGDSGGISVVYVVSRYPAVSHTFIQREVMALRRLGVAVHMIGLRRSDVDDLLNSADHEEFRRTYAVRPASVRTLILCHLRAVLTGPVRYLRVAASAARHGSGLKGRMLGLGYFGQAVVVWRFCVKHGVRHIHAHFERPPADVAMLAAMVGGPERGWSWSFTAHRPEGYMDDRAALARKVRKAAFVVCVSYYGRSQLMGLVAREHWGKMHLVRCGVDPSLMVRGRPHAALARRLLTVARLEPVKGHAVLLEALASLRAEGISLESIVVGDGSQRSALERLAEDLGIGQEVQFTGSLGQDAVRRAYESADLFCLPSFDEGVPVVLMEAMAMELPVVATWVAGVPELVQDGVSGMLTAPGKPEQLAACLRSLLQSDSERREAMGAAGRARVSAAFRDDVAADRLRALFVAHAHPAC
jgi:colanic acid/amylovoran biosynthesis glycosyltransferase